MPYEYKVVPAPSKGRKATGVKGAEARFAHGLEVAINALAADGWEYLRADILPSEERQGLTSTQTVYRTVLVFRRDAQPTSAMVGPAVAAPLPETERTEPQLTAERAPVEPQDQPADVVLFRHDAPEDGADAAQTEHFAETGEAPEPTEHTERYEVAEAHYDDTPQDPFAEERAESADHGEDETPPRA